MNKIFAQEDGMVMAFTALVLPLVLLIGALTIDGGKLFIRHSEVEHLGRQSSQSGLMALAEIIKAQATSNYQTQCNVEFPPSKCDSSNQFDFLSQDEINNLILNSTNQNLIINNAQDFGLTYDPRSKLSAEDFIITYPYLYNPGDVEVQIKVELETVPELLLGSIFTNPDPINYQSIAYLPLQ